MNFRPEIAKLVLAGRCSLTVRPKTGERCQFAEGRSYPMRVGRRSSGQRLTVVRVKEQTLGDIPLRTVRRTGFRTRAEFRQHWDQTHPGVWGDQSPVWLVSFVLGDLADTPRLLAARPGLPHGDYVSSPSKALPGSAEEVSAAQQGKWSREASEGLRTAQNGHLDERLRKLRSLIVEIRQYATDPAVNANLRGLERQARSIERKMASR